MWLKTLQEMYPAASNPVLYKILQNMNAETQLFIATILIFTLLFHIRFTPENITKSPTFLTTLGILGTFVGIAFGLMDFDPNDVQKSVPMLIDGIKTAVWASACGIFCALTIKLRDILSFKRKKIKKTTTSTIDDLVELLESIEQALIGEDQESVVSQQKLARKDNSDHQLVLSNSLDGFYKNVVEANAKALVAAFNEVIRDFNVKLNEQFGDNFKQLNQATEKMLVWQDAYGRQVSEMMTQQQSASKSMDIASERYMLLLERAESFNNVVGSMSQLLSGLETQRNQLDTSLESLGKLINTASTGLPQIEQHVLEMTRQLGEGVKATNSEFNDNIKHLIEHTKEQVLILDKALSEELTKSLESFGRQMASLSEKFSRDYTPITERLQAVLKIAG